MSDNPQVKKLKLNEEITDIDVNGVKNHVYHASSQILSDNEILVTLRHSENSSACSEEQNVSIIEKADNQKNGVADDKDTFEIEYKRHDDTEIVMPQGITSDSSIKILTVLSSNHSIIVDNLYESEADNNVKTLTILNPVQPQNSDGLELVGISPSVTFSDPINEQSDDIFVIEQELGECGQNAERQKESSIKQPTCPIKKTQQKPLKKVKKKNKKTKPIEKTLKTVSIDLEKLTVPLNEKLKRNPVVQTYAHKKENKNGKTKFSLGQKLYQKIPLASDDDENASKAPQPTSVYDFYDEEEEKFKAEKAKKDKELRALKERTCMYCKEVFSDPMDVLRHKREFHKTRKVIVSRKELEPYLKLENRTHCPLCYKEVCALGYKSVYIKHLMVHCEDHTFPCKVCGVKFKRKDHLQSHEKRHVVAPEN